MEKVELARGKGREGEIIDPASGMEERKIVRSVFPREWGLNVIE